MTEFPFYSLNLQFFCFPIAVFKTQSFFSRGIISPPVISNDPSILRSLSCSQSSPFDHYRKRPTLVKTMSVKPRLNCAHCANGSLINILELLLIKKNRMSCLAVYIRYKDTHKWVGYRPLLFHLGVAYESSFSKATSFSYDQFFF